MAISKKDFINYMAANGCKTKKSCKEYSDLMLDTFYLLLEEGETIRFTGIMQMRIEVARLREEQQIEENSNFVESVIANKKAKVQAEPDREKQERMEAEEQQKIHDRIDYLMKISPESANACIQALKQGNAI